MTIYYRKIYEQHFGPIPKEENGRTYEIHHIDGNHSNNSPYNLRAVPIQEHYDIHYSRGDWSACLLMASRMKISNEEKSILAKLDAQKRVRNGTHHFLRRSDGTSLASNRALDGTHAWQSPEYKLSQHRKQMALLEQGMHPFQDTEKKGATTRRLLATGTHPTQKQWECPTCGKTGSSATNYSRWHGDKCGVEYTFSKDGADKIKATYKEKYANGYINNRSKTWRIINTETGDESLVVGLKTWADLNGYNASTVDWSVKKHGSFKHYRISPSPESY